MIYVVFSFFGGNKVVEKICFFISNKRVYSKVVGYKSSILKLIVFLYFGNNLLESGIEKRILFKIVIKFI